MGLFNWVRLSAPHRPVAPPPPSRVRLPFAYACVECDSIHEGLDRGKCKACGSSAVFHVKSLLNREENRAAQRLKLAATLKAARTRNDTALLTEFRSPKGVA